MNKDIVNRRQFFRKSLSSFLEMLEPEKKENDEKQVLQKIIRPPGAKEDEHDFLSTCTSCMECEKACPHDAITFHEDQGKKTPILQLEKIPCRWCKDMPCIVACPSGALSFDEDNTVKAIAKAHLDLSLCLTSQGILCDECAMFCPVDVRAITIKNKQPVLDIDKCVGCGLCSFYCQATPNAIEIKDITSLPVSESAIKSDCET